MFQTTNQSRIHRGAPCYGSLSHGKSIYTWMISMYLHVRKPPIENRSWWQMILLCFFPHPLKLLPKGAQLYFFPRSARVADSSRSDQKCWTMRINGDGVQQHVHTGDQRRCLTLPSSIQLPSEKGGRSGQLHPWAPCMVLEWFWHGF